MEDYNSNYANNQTSFSCSTQRFPWQTFSGTFWSAFRDTRSKISVKIRKFIITIILCWSQYDCHHHPGIVLSKRKLFIIFCFNSIFETQRQYITLGHADCTAIYILQIFNYVWPSKVVHICSWGCFSLLLSVILNIL